MTLLHCHYFINYILSAQYTDTIIINDKKVTDFNNMNDEAITDWLRKFYFNKYPLKAKLIYFLPLNDAFTQKHDRIMDLVNNNTKSILDPDEVINRSYVMLDVLTLLRINMCSISEISDIALYMTISENIVKKEFNAYVAIDKYVKNMKDNRIKTKRC